MPRLPSDRPFHVVRFQDRTEADAFVRALQRFLDSSRGEAWTTKFHITEVWAPKPLVDGPLEVYLSDSALMATEAAFAPPPGVAACRGDELPADSVLVLEGAELR
jgi:hypothetical protein